MQTNVRLPHASLAADSSTKDRQVRIAFVVPDDSTSWLYYGDLMTELGRRGAQVTVISQPGDYVRLLKHAGISHIPVQYERFVSPVADARLFTSFLRIFRSHRFDVVQNITVKANLYGAAAAKFARIPVVINTVEGAGILWSDQSRLSVESMRIAVEVGLKLLKPHIRLYWFVNECDMKLYTARRLVDSANAVVSITTGVDCNHFDIERVRGQIDAFRSEIDGDPQLPVVTMVAGRLLKSKGIETFIDIAARLRANGVRARVLLVGPEEREHPDALSHDVIARAVESGLIQWLGFRDDVATIYGASDVVVTTTTYAEGVPKSIVEPMALSRAVVAVRIPSVEEVATDGKDALLIPPGDSARGAELVALLLADRALAQRIGNAARETVRSRYETASSARQSVDDVYVRRLSLPLSKVTSA
jgi:glycosyltransferase involved in cell wall biosynthesis